MLASMETRKRKKCTENCLSQPSAACPEAPNSAPKLGLQNRTKGKDRLISHPSLLPQPNCPNAGCSHKWEFTLGKYEWGTNVALPRALPKLRRYAKISVQEMRRHCISCCGLSQTEAGRPHPLMHVRDLTQCTPLHQIECETMYFFLAYFLLRPPQGHHWSRYLLNC